MITKYLLEREHNATQNSNPSYYSNKIIKTYYDSSKYLYKHKINILEGNFPSKVNFLTFSQDENYIATASFDRLNFWNLNSSYSNLKLNKMETSCCFMTSVAFSNDSSKIIYSGENFTKKNYNLFINDTNTGKILKTIFTYSIIKDVSVSPINSDVITFTNRNKRIFLCDLRSQSLNKIKIKNLKVRPFFYSLQYHPIDENIILTSTNSENDLFTFDLRNGQMIMNYDIPYYKKNITSYAFFNKKGTQILLAKSNISPILFNSNQNQPIYDFNEYGFYSPTLGQFCCFAGIEDEYIVSGSKNFNVYMWKIPQTEENTNKEIILRKINKTKFILKGHTSEVSAVSYNYSRSFLTSLEFNEKLIFWSPFKLYSESEDIENQYSFDISHEKNLRYTYSSLISSNYLFISRLLMLHVFTFSTKHKFHSYLKKILNMKPKEMEECFEKNSTIQFIFSFISQLKFNIKLINLQLLKKFKKVLEENSENNSSLNIKNLTTLFETKKVFENKFIIINSVNFLKLHINLSKKNKKKLIFLIKNKPTVDKLERLKSLKKITLIMKVMLYDLIIIFKISKCLYQVSFRLMNKLLLQIDETNNLELFRPKFLESIFKVDYYPKNNKDKIKDDNRNLTKDKILINNTKTNCSNYLEKNNLEKENLEKENLANDNLEKNNLEKNNLENDNLENNSNFLFRNTMYINEDSYIFSNFRTYNNLNFYNVYNDEFLYKLSINQCFQKNFEKEFNSLR